MTPDSGHVRVSPAQFKGEEHEESMEGMSMSPPAFQLKGADDDADPDENSGSGGGSGGGGGAGADAPADGGSDALQLKALDDEEDGAIQAKMKSFSPPAS